MYFNLFLFGTHPQLILVALLESHSLSGRKWTVWGLVARESMETGRLLYKQGWQESQNIYDVCWQFWHDCGKWRPNTQSGQDMPETKKGLSANEKSLTLGSSALQYATCQLLLLWVGSCVLCKCMCVCLRVGVYERETDGVCVYNYYQNFFLVLFIKK